MDVPQRDLPRLRRRLLRWYDAHRRDLPWRRQPRNAYLQWLAEIMLQQTQVATAVPYFNKFIERFPDVHRLAAAPLEDVLHAWAGLGYYARARNLHRTARIVDARGGHFPDNAADLEDLPGIGKYTARALASIAYDRPVAAVDGNVRRVLARLHGVTGDLSRGPASHRIWALAEQLMPRRRCGDFNQAMMELGATVCTPQRPGCHRCPWAKLCCAKRRGVQHRIPQGGRRTRPRPGTLVVAGVEHRRSLLLRRRPPQGLWGGLWELPSAEVTDERSQEQALENLLRYLVPCDVAATLCRSAAHVGSATHRLTHRTLRLEVFSCHCTSRRRPVRSCNGLKWVGRHDLDGLALPRAQHKVLNIIFAKDRRP